MNQVLLALSLILYYGVNGAHAARKDPCVAFLQQTEQYVSKSEFPWETPTPLYFGCWDSVGHHVFQKGSPWWRRYRHRWLESQDGVLPAIQVAWKNGLASLYRLPSATDDPARGYTLLAFWDNTIDSRAGSHSTFLLPGVLDFEAAVESAREAFPDIWSRYQYSVTLYASFEIKSPALPESVQ